MDNKKKTRLEEFRDLYGFSSGSLKWIPEGGDILNYIGQEIVYVQYDKPNPSEDIWVNSFKNVKVLEIGDFDPLTITYNIKYQFYESGVPVGDVLEERIIPEGFNYDITGQTLQKTTHRFTPYSLHLKAVETEHFYKRVSELFDSRPTLPMSAIKNLSESKESIKTLKTANNIVAVVKPTVPCTDNPDNEVEYTDETFVFRISQLRLRHESQTHRRLIFTDSYGRSYNVLAKEGDEFYELSIGTEYIGDLKIIDLQTI